jgi:hypothetical protein
MFRIKSRAVDSRSLNPDEPPRFGRETVLFYCKSENSFKNAGLVFLSPRVLMVAIVEAPAIEAAGVRSPCEGAGTSSRPKPGRRSLRRWEEPCDDGSALGARLPGRSTGNPFPDPFTEGRGR